MACTYVNVCVCVCVRACVREERPDSGPCIDLEFDAIMANPSH